MKFWIVVCSFYHVYNVFGTPILGGVDAEVKKYKYQVSLQERISKKRNQHFCGGSIISESFILTAAHCVDNERIKRDMKRLLIVAGITKLSDKGDKYFVKSFAIHENWNRAKIANDIAVLETIEKIRFSSAIKPIRLATHDPAEKTIAVLAGWGFTSDFVNLDETPVPNVLQVAQFKTISVKECRKQFNDAQYPGRLVISSNICIAQPKDKGICNGDSGDALINKNGTQQFGVISFGGECSEGVPGVATSVATFLDWIKEKTGIK